MVHDQIDLLQVGVLSEQTERQSRRIQDLEKMIAAKKDMLRHTEQVFNLFSKSRYVILYEIFCP